MISAGKLDRRITIETPVLGDNAYGEQTESWSTLAAVFAHVQHLKGDFEVRGDKKTYIRRRTFTVRYRADYDRFDRIDYENQKWSIENIEEIGRQQFLKIYGEQRL
jgi:SPP1 family predicted phage head-tail adaptor